MAVSDAQLRAIKKYNGKFERLYIRISPEEKMAIEKHLERTRESMNAFVKRAIADTIQREGRPEE